MSPQRHRAAEEQSFHQKRITFLILADTLRLCASAVIFKARLFEQLLGRGLKSEEKLTGIKVRNQIFFDFSKKKCDLMCHLLPISLIKHENELKQGGNQDGLI